MSKKILLASAIILILTVVLTACKGKDNDTTPESTDKVVQTVTVTGKDGGVTTVEVYEDASGDKYITNVDGDKIPLTTDDQGFSDDIGYIVTSKPSDDKNSTSSSGTENSTGGDSTASSTQPSSSSPENSSSEESSTGGGIVIGSKVQQDSIQWDEIKNPKK